MSAGCKAIQKDPTLGQGIADAFVKGKATTDANGVNDDAALQQFEQTVAKTSTKAPMVVCSAEAFAQSAQIAVELCCHLHQLHLLWCCPCQERVQLLI